MRKRIVNLLIFSLVLLCAGCAFDVGLTPPAASENYMLAVSTDTPIQPTSPNMPTVSVSRPQTNAFLNSTGIAIIQPDQKALYYAKGQWATVLPEMMQEAVIRSLNSTQRVRAFYNTQPGISSDYRLVWSIEDFYAKYSTEKSPPTVAVTLTCWLIDVDNLSQPAVSSVFTGQQPAAAKGLEPIVASFNSTVETLLSDMNMWVANTIQTQERQKALYSSRNGAASQ